MSELDIFNPQVSGDPNNLNPNYGFQDVPADVDSLFQAPSGDVFSRQNSVQGRSFQLQWLKRPLVTRNYIEWWKNQYAQDYFTIVDWERGRYYTGRFIGSIPYSPAGHEQWNVQATFVELPGKPMYQYPNTWGPPNSIFYEERRSDGTDVVKLTTPGAAWTWASPNANYHNGSAYLSNVLNATAEWQYYGYGFRVFSYKGPDRGIVEISLDGAILGTVDLYAAAGVASAVVFTKPDVSLGMHRVKLRVTGNKNAASSNTYIDADALEVMR